MAISCRGLTSPAVRTPDPMFEHGGFSYMVAQKTRHILPLTNIILIIFLSRTYHPRAEIAGKLHHIPAEDLGKSRRNLT